MGKKQRRYPSGHKLVQYYGFEFTEAEKETLEQFTGLYGEAQVWVISSFLRVVVIPAERDRRGFD